MNWCALRQTIMGGTAARLSFSIAVIKVSLRPYIIKVARNNNDYD